MHRLTRRAAVGASLTLLVAALASGCGSGDESKKTSTSGTPKVDVSTLPEGGQLFVKKCGMCHTLDAAGTDGDFGPHLDRRPLEADYVRGVIRDGRGQMPSGVASGDDADAIAAYVADEATKANS